MASQATSHEPRSDTDDRYADIYDFALVGLLSVDSQGCLVKANLAAAIFLGIQRSQCHQHHFVDFLHDEARASFEELHREVLSGRCRRHCDPALKAAAHRGPTVVRLEATVDESGQENRMVMVDVTDAYERFEQLQSRGSDRARGVSESMLLWSGAQGTMGRARRSLTGKRSWAERPGLSGGIGLRSAHAHTTTRSLFRQRHRPGLHEP